MESLALSDSLRYWVAKKVSSGIGVRVDRSYDIPYLGGYSEDGRTIYLDRRLPSVLFDGKNWFDPGLFIAVHERVEKAIIAEMGYEQAHAIATVIEHMMVSDYGLDPAEYEHAIKPYIKMAAEEPIVRVPRDLDNSPYVNDAESLKKISEAQRL